MNKHLSMRSGNPALQSSTFRNHLSAVTEGTMTLSGTVNKTGIGLLLIILSAGYTWGNPAMHGLVIPSVPWRTSTLETTGAGRLNLHS